MSSISVNTITDASGGSTTSINGFTPTVSNMAGRNRIINGDMRIDQRNAGASVTPSVLYSTYTLDRWNTVYSVGSKFSVQQNANSVTPPTGFKNYLGVTSLSAYTPGSAEQYTLKQAIEGYNIADLGWGSSGASSVTLSFFVRSSLTGTFGAALSNSAGNRSYPFTYTISAANTWEQKTVTITGDTTGTWLSTNGVGVEVIFSLGAGSTYLGNAGAWGGAAYTGATGQTNLVATSGATFYITGVQLEAGSVATPFEHRQYGQELALCQRYYESSNLSGDIFAFISLSCYTTTAMYGSWIYKVTKRATPTISYNSTPWLVYSNASQKTFSSITSDGIGQNHTSVVIQGSGWSSGYSALAKNLDANAITASAEL